jgi:succinylglutamate desuccinylase
VLLHGNEDSGVVALQSVLRAYGQRLLPRALSILIGNVAAAREGLRRLDHQPDYNRVWPGGKAHTETPEYAAMQQVHSLMQARGVFASIDIHNNTGLNPHYCVISRLDQAALHPCPAVFAHRGLVSWSGGNTDDRLLATLPRR